MERIQTAIEKARARRQGDDWADRQPAVAPRNPEPAQAPGTDAWARMAELKPVAAVMHRNRILTFEGGPGATPFDMLRTKVLQQMRTNNWRRVAVTSPNGFCGKTTLCANLGFSLARQADIRTALIDMDMRRPALARTLGVERGSQQFSRALEGKADPLDHMLRYGTNLAVGLSNASVRNPSELLQSDTAHTVIDDLEACLDLTLTIFDMPPMMVTDDVQAFAGHVDCVLLVAAAGTTTVKEIDTCERELAALTNVLGVVLNKCRYPEHEHSYGYYD